MLVCVLLVVALSVCLSVECVVFVSVEMDSQFGRVLSLLCFFSCYCLSDQWIVKSVAQALERVAQFNCGVYLTFCPMSHAHDHIFCTFDWILLARNVCGSLYYNECIV